MTTRVADLDRAGRRVMERGVDFSFADFYGSGGTTTPGPEILFMAEPARQIEVDVSHLTTEDDQPVDNPFQDKQMRLLTECLYTSWQPKFPFVVMSDVAMYYSVNEDPLVPDVLLSTRVSLPADLMKKTHRSYFVWEYGKVPDVVIEIVSNSSGGELDTKLQGYAQRNVPYYAVFDPKLYLGDRPLRCFEFSPSGYIEMVKPVFVSLGLSLTVWTGEYETYSSHWLRWCDASQQLLPFGKEAVAAEGLRADLEHQRAEQERQRAQTAEEENARLRQLLLDAGLQSP